MKQLLMIITCLLALGGSCGPVQAAAGTQAASTVAVQGNHLVDGSGHVLVLVGATRWALEFSCHGDGHDALADFQAMRSWGMNTVRLTLSSAYWLNLAGRCPDYQQTVARAIANAEAAGLLVVP